MKSCRRIASLSRARERENAYYTRGTEPPRANGETSASRISYFTEGSAVFRGKCTVSILSVSRELEERLKIYIA